MTPMLASPAHPVAALFPMMDDEKLAELAADIRERGLLYPIVRDDQDRILDGRNREVACQMAGVPPSYAVYQGPDPAGYALAVNMARRSLRKGQEYMIREQARRLAEANGQKMQKSALSRGSGEQHGLSEAAIVLDFGPSDLAPAVAAGTMPLSKAVEEARERKRRQGERESRQAALRAEAPDLAARVDDDQVSPEEAWTLFESRRTEQQRKDEEHRKEHEEGVRRAAGYVTEFVDLWRAVLSRGPRWTSGDPFANEVLAALRPGDRDYFLEMERRLGA
jgi:hypothetical protein